MPTDLEVVDEMGLLEALVEDGREEDEDEHAGEADSLHANATVELVIDKEGRKVVWSIGGEVCVLSSELFFDSRVEISIKPTSNQRDSDVDDIVTPALEASV